jgi:hypothetical protein
MPVAWTCGAVNGSSTPLPLPDLDNDGTGYTNTAKGTIMVERQWLDKSATSIVLCCTCGMRELLGRDVAKAWHVANLHAMRAHRGDNVKNTERMNRYYT